MAESNDSEKGMSVGMETGRGASKGASRKGQFITINVGDGSRTGIFAKGLFLVLLLSAVACLCFYVVRQMSESNPEMDDSRKEIAMIGIMQLVDELRASVGEKPMPKRIAVLHFAYDPSDFVTMNIRQAVQHQGGFQVVKSPLWDRFCRMIGRVNDGVITREQAISQAEGDGVEGVLWGRVDRLENERDGATFTGEYELYDLKNKRPVYSGKIRESTVPGRFAAKQDGVSRLGAYRLPLEGMPCLGIPWHIRFLWFVLGMLLLPIVTISFIRTMVAKKSNGVNAFVLGIYTTVDLILAFFMVGGSLSSFFAVVVFLLAGILAFLYNIKIMTFAVRLEE